MDVQRTNDPKAFRDAAGPLLLADEARHNLVLGILSTAMAQPAIFPELRGWVVHDRNRVLAAALRTPPHNLVLARALGDAALAALAAAIRDELPGIVGAVPEVDRFADEWASRRGLTVEPRFEQRIYALRRLLPADPVEGGLRLANIEDRPLLAEWVGAFAAEALADGPLTDSERLARSVDARLGSPDGGFGIWEVEGRPVSVAGFGGPTPTGIRIGPVYTPPAERRRGYGGAVTRAVSAMLLDGGRRVCFLYTDLANPTSNAIYSRLGYEPVCDSRELAFAVPRRQVSD